MKIILILLILLSFQTKTHSEESFYFKRLSTENGLAQNTVFCILQDNQGFMWFGTKDGLCRYDGYRFKIFRNEKDNNNSIGNNFIRSIHEDENGNIWVGTDVGAYIYDKKTERFTPFSLKTHAGIKIEKEVNDIKQDKNGNFWFAVDWQGVFFYDVKKEQLQLYKLNNIVNAWNIYIDRQNDVWIGTHGGGLNKFNPQQSKFEAIAQPRQRGENENAIDDIYKLYSDNYDELLVATATGGVKRFDQVNNQLPAFIEGANNKKLFVRDIMRRSADEIWLGTESGIYIYNEKTKKTHNIRHSHNDNFTLSDNAVYCLYKDKEGGIWAGTYFGGVSYYPAQYTPFEKYYPLGTSNSIKGKRIREIAQDKYGRYWVGTEDDGLTVFDPETNKFINLEPSQANGSISYHNIHGLMADDNHMWVGTFGHGLDIVDINTLKVVKHFSKTKDPKSICDNSVFSIFKDRSNNIWVGTLYGLAKYDEKTESFEKIGFLGDSFIYDILQTSDGLLWFATLGKGLYQYDLRNNKWKTFRHNNLAPNGLPHDKIISLFEDSRKKLWIATEGGGLSMYDQQSDKFKNYTTNEGLPNNIIYKILEDDAHKLWLSTNQGLVCLNIDNDEIKTYTTSNGLLYDQFNYKSGIKSRNGKLLFGGLNGFISFDPKSFNLNPFVPPVYITNISVNNQPISPSTENSLLKNSLTFGGRIDLNFDQSSFNIDFASLSYTAPENNEYTYILEGYDKEWINIDENQRAHYANVPPGKYTFKVKGSNNDGIWNTNASELEIVIHPPFYKSVFAYITYTILLIVGITLIIKNIRKRTLLKNKRKQELLDIEKDKELYNAKIAFFTNIAHEIRTPLSLIKGPLEYIIKTPVGEKERGEQLEVIDKNTNRLLELTNQLLDFRKTEKEGFKLNFVKTDIIDLIQSIYVRFEQTAKHRGITFDLKLPDEHFYADIDREAFTKIVSNLFGNAIKFAQSQIIVSFTTSNQNINLSVANDGSQIPEELKEKIFEPFFQIESDESGQVRSGTGLGLPLARSLASLHDGSLFLEKNNLNSMTTFILSLPIDQENTLILKKNEQDEISDKNQSIENDSINKKLTILLSEDDKDLLNFLSKILKSQYNVIKTNNGQEALQKLDTEQVDLVITDITMPVMDGLELCREIKTDINNSHIPVVILTARTGVALQIEGLEAGADAYIEKPFSTEYLLAQISNLFSNRAKIKEAFVHSPYSNAGSIALTKADEQFLEKVTDIIHKNIAEESFNVDSLARELGMSRSSLHRKIKGISELTPNDFIVLVKLKKAAEYLNQGLYRVNEVCYVVGFSSSSYFSRCFKKHFGVSPREFITNRTT